MNVFSLLFDAYRGEALPSPTATLFNLSGTDRLICKAAAPLDAGNGRGPRLPHARLSRPPLKVGRQRP